MPSMRLAALPMPAVAASVLAAGLAGCSASDDTGGLPEITDVTSPATTPTGPSLTPDQQAVADAVTRYDQVLTSISDGAPLDEKRIKSVAVDPWATTIGKRIFEFKALEKHTTGTHVSVIESVVLKDETAEVVDCTDARKTEIVSASDSPPTTVSGGDDILRGTTSLIRVRGKWLVKNFDVIGKCDKGESE
jgi:hypothetical protein